MTLGIEQGPQGLAVASDLQQGPQGLVVAPDLQQALYLVCFPYKRHDMMNNSCKRHALTDTAATRSFFLFVESEGYRLEFGGYQVEGAV